MKRVVRQKESVYQDSFSRRTTRDNCHGYLKATVGTVQARRKFVAALIATILAVRGRVNYRNLARYGEYSERTYARQFAQSFPWLNYHALVIQRTLPASHRRILVQDASFISKSGKRTFGLDWFYNGCASRAERGLEIHACAVVDLTQKGAYVAAVAQTPAMPELKKDDAEKTRLDFALQQVQTVQPHLAADIQHLAADGAFANKKYADGVVAAGLQLVTKLRTDANMRFRFTGPRTGKKGRPQSLRWQSELARLEPL
jgi:hypothetical protein